MPTQYQHHFEGPHRMRRWIVLLPLIVAIGWFIEAIILGR